MNMHDALTRLIYVAMSVPLALTFWLVCDGLQRIEAIREGRHNRRLDRVSDREIRKQFNRIVNHDDGIERP